MAMPILAIGFSGGSVARRECGWMDLTRTMGVKVTPLTKLILNIRNTSPHHRMIGFVRHVEFGDSGRNGNRSRLASDIYCPFREEPDWDVLLTLDKLYFFLAQT